MLVLEFDIYAGIERWKQDFRVKFNKHLMTRPWSPVQVKQWSEHDSKKPKDQPVKTKNSKDLNRKCWILRDKELHLNRGETDVKGPHAEGSTSSKHRNHYRGRRPRDGLEWAQTGRPSPFLGPFVAPFDLAASQTIYSPLAKSHTSTHLTLVIEERRREGHHSGEERVKLVV
jgi:hypothetical protein